MFGIVNILRYLPLELHWKAMACLAMNSIAYICAAHAHFEHTGLNQHALEGNFVGLC